MRIRIRNTGFSTFFTTAEMFYKNCRLEKTEAYFHVKMSQFKDTQVQLVFTHNTNPSDHRCRFSKNKVKI